MFIDVVVVVFVVVRVDGGGGGVPGAGTGDIGVDALDWWLVLDTIECSNCCCHRYCIKFSKRFASLNPNQGRLFWSSTRQGGGGGAKCPLPPSKIRVSPSQNLLK